MKSFLLGGQIVLATTFIDPTTGQNVNPSTVTLELLDPLGNTTTPAVSNPGVGIYKALVTPTVAGVWTCRWEGAGAVQAATETRFEIRPSAFQS